MENIRSYDQYTQVLSEFKQSRGRCASNKMPTREELLALIDAGKLKCDRTDSTLWLFTDEGYFYTSWFVVAKDAPISMCKADHDVLTELYGNDTRYQQQWEDELIAAGFEKYDMYKERSALLTESSIEQTRKKNATFRKICSKMGYSFRKATKEDYPEMAKLWEDVLGKHRYTINAMTDAELSEMERYGRCALVCGENGEILATSMYIKRGNAAYPFHTATYCPELGLGACATNEMTLALYEEGCRKSVFWIREGNREAIRLNRKSELTGKFYQQFVWKASC